MIQKTIKLNNGVDIPVVGFGVYKIPEGPEVEQAVTWALQSGYRMIDTAKRYANESGVGRAVRAAIASGAADSTRSLTRADIFVTTKLWTEDHGYENALKAFAASNERLGLEYVDLYLIHWPGTSSDPAISENKRAQTWKAFEELYAAGKIKAIGVSNYTITHLEEMKQYAKIMPAVNQVEFHPFIYQTQKPLLEYCKAQGILLQAYSPLVHGTKLDDPRITTVAKKYNRSNAQVLLRWGLQHGCIVLPKSTQQERIKQNIDVFDFELSAEDMEALNALSEQGYQGWDPRNIK